MGYLLTLLIFLGSMFFGVPKQAYWGLGFFSFATLSTMILFIMVDRRPKVGATKSVEVSTTKTESSIPDFLAAKPSPKKPAPDFLSDLPAKKEAAPKPIAIEEKPVLPEPVAPPSEPPVAPKEEKPAVPEPAKTEAPPPPAAPESNGKAILMIDDESQATDAIKKLMEPKGYQVLTAEECEPGLEIFKKEKDRVVVVFLPFITLEMMGETEKAFNDFRAADPNSKLIFSRGVVDKFVPPPYLQNIKDVEFLEKPFKPEAVEALITKLTGG
jgi:hypothetical protein